MLQFKSTDHPLQQEAPEPRILSATRNKHPGVLVQVRFMVMIVLISICFDLDAQKLNLNKILSNKELNWLKAHGDSIRVAPNPSWPPGDYVEDGVHKGIVADYVALFEEMLGVKFQRVYYRTWGEMLDGIINGEVDFLGAIHQTSERDKYLLFSEVYMQIPLGIIVRNSYQHALSHEHINTMVLSSTRDYASSEFVRHAFPGAQIDEHDEDITALTMASTGVSDGAVIDFMTASYLIEKYGITNLKLGAKLDFEWKLRFGISRENPELASIITKMLSAIPQEQKRQIYQRWVQDLEYHKTGFFERNKILLFWIAGGVMMVLFIVVFFIIYLRHLVDQRTRELNMAKVNALGHEEKYRLIVDNQTDLVIKLNTEGQFIFASPSYCQFFDISAAALTNITFSMAGDGLPDRSFKQILQAINEPPHQITLEEKIQHHSSEEWVSWVFSGIINSQTNQKEIIGVGRIITALKNQEKKLREHAEDLMLMHDINDAIRMGKDMEEVLDLLGLGLQKVYECTSAVTAVANAEKTHLYVHKISYPDHMALKLEKLIGRKVSDLSLRIPATGKGYFAKVMRSGKPMIIEGDEAVRTMLSEFAQQRFLSAFVSPVASLLNIKSIILLPLSSKNETLGVVEVARNRSFTESEFLRIERLASLLSTVIDRWLADEALKASEERYRTIFNSANDGITILKGDRFIHCNTKALEMFGATYEEFTDSPPWDFSPDFQPNGQNSREMAISLIQDAFQGIPKRFEWTHQTLTGTKFFTEVTLNRFVIQETTFIMAIVRDITEQKRNKAELIRAKEQAEESNRLKTHFLANMSHEIRTPMNGILGFIELMRDLNLSKEEQDEYLRLISQSANRLLGTINDIIEMSRIEAGEISLHKSNILLSDVMEYLHDFFMPQAEAKGLDLKHVKAADITPLCAYTDKRMLESILMNLIRNAIKFTAKGEVAFGYRAEGELLRFFVKDTGKGVPAHFIDKIFDRFMQADLSTTRGHEGSGLGLTIARGLVEQLGGQIGCDSREGEGSTFWFNIPYQICTQPPKLLNADEIHSVQNPHPMNNKPTLLIAEDDDTSFLLLETILAPFGANILRAKTGDEAIALATAHKDLALILMDLKMPGIEGMEATRQIRAFNQKVPIVAQTAYAMTGDREKAIEAGCTDYITKPMRRESFLEIILPLLPHNHP